MGVERLEARERKGRGSNWGGGGDRGRRGRRSHGRDWVLFGGGRVEREKGRR
jgi:hypothetical protein